MTLMLTPGKARLADLAHLYWQDAALSLDPSARPGVDAAVEVVVRTGATAPEIPPEACPTTDPVAQVPEVTRTSMSPGSALFSAVTMPLPFCRKTN